MNTLRCQCRAEWMNTSPIFVSHQSIFSRRVSITPETGEVVIAVAGVQSSLHQTDQASPATSEGLT